MLEKNNTQLCPDLSEQLKKPKEKKLTSHYPKFYIPPSLRGTTRNLISTKNMSKTQANFVIKKNNLNATEQLITGRDNKIRPITLGNKAYQEYICQSLGLLHPQSHFSNYQQHL